MLLDERRAILARNASERLSMSDASEIVDALTRGEMYAKGGGGGGLLICRQGEACGVSVDTSQLTRHSLRSQVLAIYDHRRAR